MEITLYISKALLRSTKTIYDIEFPKLVINSPEISIPYPVEKMSFTIRNGVVINIMDKDEDFIHVKIRLTPTEVKRLVEILNKAIEKCEKLKGKIKEERKVVSEKELNELIQYIDGQLTESIP